MRSYPCVNGSIVLDRVCFMRSSSHLDLFDIFQQWPFDAFKINNQLNVWNMSNICQGVAATVRTVPLYS